MKYIYLHDGKSVHEIQPENNPDFPGVPINERFSSEYLSRCIAVNDDIEVQPGWTYDKDTSAFYEPDFFSNILQVGTGPSKLTGEPSVTDYIMSMLVNQEYRIALLELGV